MKLCVFDIETNGLNPSLIHCLTAAIFSQGEWRLKSTTDYDEMRKFFLGADVLVGHNITRYDIPVVERLLNIKVEAKLIDTLFLTWYLYPERNTFGLADFGEMFGVPKPKVEDWDNLPIETYIHRCQEDVKINCKLWSKIEKDLLFLYDNDQAAIDKLVEYLMFKADCAREAERSRWKLDVQRCLDSLEMLEGLKEEKVQQLKEAMPKQVKYKTVERPIELYKKPTVVKKPKSFEKANGELTAAGIKYVGICAINGFKTDIPDEILVPSKELTKKGIEWLDLLEQLGLPETHTEPIEVVKSTDEPNPNSTQQIKDWLFSLGWVPETYNKVGDREVEQVRVVKDGEKFLCNSVKKLIEVEPAIEALDGISVLSHRIGILKGYLSNMDNEGYIQAQVNGLANTLRFKHKAPCVNLPSVNKPFGDIIRGCLIAPEGYELCGSDMAALENRIRDHYIYPYDPEYVETMLDPAYDSHLAIAVKGGFITEEESQFYKWYKKNH